MSSLARDIASGEVKRRDTVDSDTHVLLWTWRPHVVKLVKPPAKESKETDSQYPEPMAPHRSTRDTKQIHRTKEKWE